MAIVKSDVKLNYRKLCLTEKLFIVTSFEDNRLLNKKSESVHILRHKNKLFLKILKK